MCHLKYTQPMCTGCGKPDRFFRDFLECDEFERDVAKGRSMSVDEATAQMEKENRRHERKTGKALHNLKHYEPMGKGSLVWLPTEYPDCVAVYPERECFDCSEKCWKKSYPLYSCKKCKDGSNRQYDDARPGPSTNRSRPVRGSRERSDHRREERESEHLSSSKESGRHQVAMPKDDLGTAYTGKPRGGVDLRDDVYDRRDEHDSRGSRRNRDDRNTGERRSRRDDRPRNNQESTRYSRHGHSRREY